MTTIIADDTFVKEVFSKDSKRLEEVNLIIDYVKYNNWVIETIPTILDKYIPKGSNTPGSLFVDNIITGWGHINFPEIEPWSEEACILTLCNTSCTLSEKVWLITEINYENIDTPTEENIAINPRIEIWDISILVKKIKADEDFVRYIENLEEKEADEKTEERS